MKKNMTQRSQMKYICIYICIRANYIALRIANIIFCLKRCEKCTFLSYSPTAHLKGCKNAKDRKYHKQLKEKTGKQNENPFELYSFAKNN